jgi:xanthine dehydrogenase accessory factor
LKRSLLQKIVAANERGWSAVLVTDLASGRQALIERSGVLGDLAIAPEDRARIEEAIAQTSSLTLDTHDARLFVECYEPPLRLILVGAVHIAQALAPMASQAGYRVTIVDPRSAFASPERFPDCAILADWPDEAMTALAPDHRTAVVTLSHDPKLDDTALIAALATEAFYVGALGSRKTQARRLERLAAAGIEPEALARIHGPVGLAIGAITPAEIGISILAEMTRTLRAWKIRAREAAAPP